MIHKFILTLLIIIILKNTYSQWTSTGGPVGFSCTSLGTNNSTIFAAIGSVKERKANLYLHI